MHSTIYISIRFNFPQSHEQQSNCHSEAWIVIMYSTSSSTKLGDHQLSSQYNLKPPTSSPSWIQGPTKIQEAKRGETNAGEERELFRLGVGLLNSRNLNTTCWRVFRLARRQSEKVTRQEGRWTLSLSLSPTPFPRWNIFQTGQNFREAEKSFADLAGGQPLGGRWS